MWYLIKTLGCKANFYDSELLEQAFQSRGVKPFQNQSQSQELLICVVNSCTVTDEADRQSRKLASKLRRDHPDSLVVMTGCAAEVDPERLAGTPGLTYVVGNQDKLQLVDTVLKRISERQMNASVETFSSTPGSAPAEILGEVSGYESFLSRHPMDREWPVIEDETLNGFRSKTRAFLKIQEGCNAFCTYCIIPYGRGPSRSLEMEAVIERVQRVMDTGAKEVVLTGTNIGDYGTDLGVCFEDLVEAILKQTSLARLRLSSLDPVEITPRLLKLVETESRLCPHFHVSLQSPQTKILRLMKRKYKSEDVELCLRAISELKIPSQTGAASLERPFIGMDLITGFPGETAEDFQWGVDFLKELPWSRLHVFPYSERNGTPATRLPRSVPFRERKERARVLNALSLSRQEEQVKNLLIQMTESQTCFEDILIERVSADGAGQGYTRAYTRVGISSGLRSEDQNQILSVKPKSIEIDPVSTEVWVRGERN